ncbi:MAG: cell division protein FtsA [Parcubacteria group bacterium Gr01-1014_8]|nr:MAG: cell division protein FtsA [Parcubacteria group bacterium Gr01-1014_8]
MRRTIYTGIDIGTYHVKAVIASPPDSPELPMTIIGTGSASSKGMRHGYLVDPKEVTRSIREAVGRAAQASKTPVRSARIAMGGVSLEEMRSTGDVTLTTSGGIATEREIERSQRESEKKAISRLINRTILHTIPLEYRIDGIPVRGRPHGLQGTKLSVDTLIISILTQHHDDLIDAVESAGIEVEGVMASPLAASFVTLTKAQKTAGVVLANIGAETLSIIVYDNDVPISVKVFPIGSSDITNAIALSFQIPLSEAEQMKRGAVTGSDIPPRKMGSIVSSQLKEMYLLMNAHLKTIGRHRLLPAGIVITGGGSGVAQATDIARTTLRIPSQIGVPAGIPRLGSLDATWAVAYGLCRWAYTEDAAAPMHTFGDILSRTIDSLRTGFRTLLP